MVAIFFTYLQTEISDSVLIPKKEKKLKIVEKKSEAKLKNVTFVNNDELVEGLTLDINNIKKTDKVGKIYGYLKFEIPSVDGVIFKKEEENSLTIYHIEMKSDTPDYDQILKKFQYSKLAIEHLINKFYLKEKIKNTNITKRIKVNHKFILLKHQKNSKLRTSSKTKYEEMTKNEIKFYNLGVKDNAVLYIRNF